MLEPKAGVGVQEGKGAPKSVKSWWVCNYRLDRMDGKIAVKVLKGTQVFVNKQDQNVTHNLMHEFDGWKDEQLKRYARTGEEPEVIAVQPKGTA